MKKILFLAVMFVFVLSGCAERRFHTLTYDKSYDYDTRLPGSWIQ